MKTLKYILKLLIGIPLVTFGGILLILAAAALVILITALLAVVFVIGWILLLIAVAILSIWERIEKHMGAIIDKVNEKL